jgi:hypothetical protein
LCCSWPGTSKTLAGTAIGALSGVAFAAMLAPALAPSAAAVGGVRSRLVPSQLDKDAAAAPTPTLALGCAILTVSILETFTQQIDNLILPAIATALFATL